MAKKGDQAAQSKSDEAAPLQSDNITLTDEEIALAHRALQDCLGCGAVEAAARVSADPTMAKQIATFEQSGDRRSIVQLLYS